MARKRTALLFIGIYNSVLALDAHDGVEIWRARVGAGLHAFVNVFWDGEALFASSKGEVFRLDPRTGEILWHNKLKGLGTGFVTFATTRAPSTSSAAIAAAEAARQASESASTTAAM